jgi:cytochrome c553
MKNAAMKTIAAAVILVAASVPAFGASGNAEAGGKKAQEKGCPACHGANGISISPDFPNLAGQNDDYIAATLRHYIDGQRKNPIMTAQVQAAKLTERDIEDLAAYFSSQHGLYVKE